MVDTEEWRQESLDRGVFVVEVKNVNRGCEDDFAHTLRYLSLGRLGLAVVGASAAAIMFSSDI